MEDKRALFFTIDGNEVDLGQVMEFLGSIPLLQQLPVGLIRKIAHAVELRRFGAGEVLVKEGEPGEGFYMIWKGQAEVSQPSDNGGTTNVLKPGDYFGSACSEPGRELHKADVVALNEVICLVLSHKHHQLICSESIWTEDQKMNVATVERILELEKLDVDLFRGITLLKSNYRPVFGGQLIGQALAAACKSVDPLLLVHSLHSYFLRGGDESFPIIYQVQRVRDGQRFATRHVTASQYGREIFRLTASFQREEESVEHQDPMPDAPRPEEILSSEALEQRHLVDARIPASIRKKLAASPTVQLPVDLRLCDPEDPVNPVRLEPRQRLWLRARQKLSDDQLLHCCVAAYLSDFHFLSTSGRPHKSSLFKRFRLLSLDHSMWFHRRFRADEWLLFVMRSPVARGGRGLSIGHMYTQSGQLAVTVAQEGVIQKYIRKSKL